MTNSMRSLLWLKWQYIVTNKVLLVVVLSPIVDVYLMSLLGPSADAMLLSFGTGLVYSVTAGSFVTLIVAEEKEKKNIRTLILTGVHQLDYAISVIAYPLILSVLSLILLPFLFQRPVDNWLVYSLVTILTALAYIAINFVIALVCQTQVQAAMCSMLVMALGSFLPMLMFTNDMVKTVVSFSFFGASSNYLYASTGYQLTDTSFIALLVWLILLFYLLGLAFRFNRSH
ncbi:hypothetical protein ACQRD4_05440 [Streptococcus hyointestinalis]|uniref:Membrane protein n=1 Tax=Streptococcus hyointestinalis TaxID=1337 RepID=A0A380K4N0_9STRE|nr:hypothetical protein [Streptococcus hyointestinalis]MDD6384815.1 hypothetical protein [Streptococcus hyointestinalis]SUN59983.1 membrane protein [Streptococcus hyointestinalis]